MSAQTDPSDLPQTYSTVLLENRGYKLLSQIGKGRYAKVYMSEFRPFGNNNQSTEQTVLKLASKVINTKDETFTRKFVKKFLPRELHILTQINHPYIIHIHSILQIRYKYYIFMRYAENHDLLDFLMKNGAINENQARVWTRQIALALQYLHALNIAHRDMKCENILISQNYNVKLADFGFARYTIDANNKPIQSETYCGSLLYASPELLHGHKYNPKISDIWSFGVIIYVMLNKAMPFQNSTAKVLYENQIKKNYKFRSQIAPLLSQHVKDLVKNCMEPEPLKRYVIDDIVNSDWIAMDSRLTVLGSFEKSALDYAFENPVTPPANIALPRVSDRSSKTTQIIDKEAKVETIKPYGQNEPPRISENSKITSEVLDHVKSSHPTVTVDMEATNHGSLK